MGHVLLALVTWTSGLSICPSAMMDAGSDWFIEGSSRGPEQGLRLLRSGGARLSTSAASRNAETISRAICERSPRTVGVDLEMEHAGLRSRVARWSAAASGAMGRDRGGVGRDRRPGSRRESGSGCASDVDQRPRRCRADTILSEEAPEETADALRANFSAAALIGAVGAGAARKLCSGRSRADAEFVL